MMKGAPNIMQNLDDIKKKARVPIASKTISYSVRVDRTLLANFKAAVVSNGSNVTHTLTEFMKAYVQSCAISNPNNPDYVKALVGFKPGKEPSELEMQAYQWLENHGYLITAIREYRYKDIFIVSKGKMIDYKFELRFNPPNFKVALSILEEQYRKVNA